MCRLGCASNFVKFVARHGTPVFMVEWIWGGAIHVLWIMDRTSNETREERDFRDTVGVHVSKTRHRFSNHNVKIFVLYMSVGQINYVLGWAVIGHLVGALEPERFTSCRASYTQFFDDSLILSTAQELKINYSFPACTSRVRLGMTGLSKVPTFYMQLRQHWPQPPRGRVVPNSDANICVTCRSALLLPAKSVMNCRGV